MEANKKLCDEVKQIDKLTDLMMVNFVNKLGYDGNAYIEMFEKVPVLVIKSNNDLISGRYVAPDNSDPTLMDEYIKVGNFSEEEEKRIKDIGIIVIYDKTFEDEREKIVTLLHEKIHARRCLLYYGPDTESGYRMDKDGHLIQLSNRKELQYVDPGQDILHGSVDDSKKSIRTEISKGKDYAFAVSDTDKIKDKRHEDINIDEGLTELMANVAYDIYDDDCLEILDDVDVYTYDGNNYAERSMIYVSQLIGKYQNLDLFKWMIDPITYNLGDLNYDYFSAYIKENEMKSESLKR